MAVMKTPGVYIREIDAFPNSVVQVETAVPVFIGHTEKALNGRRSLTGQPFKIGSMAEFEQYFGGAPVPLFDVTDKETPVSDADGYDGGSGYEPADIEDGGKSYWLKREGNRYMLHSAMRMFYANGGGQCYVLSVGSYDDPIVMGRFIGDGAAKLPDPFVELTKEQEITLVVVPEAVRLGFMSCITVQQKMLKHCGELMNRFAVLDIWDGWRDRKDQVGDVIDKFRDKLGTDYLDYASAYYPWLNTTLFPARSVNFMHLTDNGKKTLQAMIRSEMGIEATTATRRNPPPAANADDNDGGAPAPAPATQELTPEEKQQEQLKAQVNKITELKDFGVEGQALDKLLRSISEMYREVTGGIARRLNLLPPSSIMVGRYTMVDSTRGVWKAPANISINSVSGPTVNISDTDQAELNVTVMGKSINAIRPFVGEGTLVWGARTLDGNSLDWRYINVRRTMIMIEESIKLAAKAYVFEPNTANTWVTVRGMITNFLTSVWKAGGLAGAVPEDAFSVYIGLGETMTPNDILEGIMKVTVLLAPTRPAEFIEITFQQQQQRS